MKERKGFGTLGTLLIGGIGTLVSAGAYSYFQLQEAINKGIIVLDVSTTMPGWIADAIHAVGILPKTMKLKYIIKAVAGSETEKSKYLGMVNSVLKYFTVNVTKSS